MKIIYKSADPAKIKTPALFVFLFEDDKSGLAKRPELASLKSKIGPRIKAGDFKSRFLSILTLFDDKPGGAKRLVLIGLGSRKKFQPDRLRTAAAKAAQKVRALKLETAAILLPENINGLDSVEDALEKVSLGFNLGLYKYDELKTKDKPAKKPIKEITIIGPAGVSSAKVKKAITRGQTVAQAICYARDLINRPANLLKPEDLAREARKLAKENSLKIKVMGLAEAKRKKMGAFLAVGQGSASPGRIIVLEYKGAGPRVKPLALVGKAVTFDSGGLNLKPGAGMKDMKTDMAGSAAVMAVMAALAQLKVKDNLLAIIPAVENMPDGMSYRPGDVITTMAGLSVEITNTDAEGRLTLADGITLAAEYKPRGIIDIATLTGAVGIALGDKIAGLMGTSRDMIDALTKAGEKSGDRVWELPLYEDYFDSLKSQTADFNNAGARGAGTIVAGLFLKQFVQDLPWAHLDIAGTGRADKSKPDVAVGGTGFGVALFLEYLRS